jgi:hypothetical protein
MAWLQAPVDPDFKHQKNHESRLEKFDENAEELQYEPEAYSTYIINIANSIGLYLNGGYGPIPITWTEILSWSILTKTKITPWEACLIMKLSKAFVSQLSISKNPSCISPIQEIDEEKLELKRKAISDAFKAMPAIKRSKK